MTQNRRTGARQGRRARLARRAAAPEVNPCPPGQPGGRYRPLDIGDMQAVFDTALRLLDAVGLGQVPARLADRFLQAGARRLPGDRIALPPELVRQAIADAASQIALHGRDPDRTIRVGGNSVHFGTGGAAVQVLDLESHRYRPATLADLHDFTRLQDRLTNISWFTRCCIATDIEDTFALDANTAYALIRNTTKPVGTAFTQAAHVAPIARMLDIAAGGPGAFADRPFLKAHISPIVSPLRFAEDAVDVVFACIEHGIPLSCITAAQAGATAPATLAGFLSQSLAETLASLVMVHVIRPGHPMVFSNWPFVVDLRSGAFSGGGGETALLNAASAQLSNWLGLPSGVACSMTDAKLPDAQYGTEKALTALAAALAGGNLIYESAGMTAALLGASFEAFVLDDEMLSHVYRTLRGVEVNAETLGFEAIRAAVLGEGHFLGGEQTLAAMERDYFYPTLADRDPPRTWEENGAPDAWSRAREKAADILRDHHPDYLDRQQDRAMRAALPDLR